MTHKKIKIKKKNKEKKMLLDMSELRWSEIQKVEAMIRERKLTDFNKWVLGEYLKSLKNGV